MVRNRRRQYYVDRLFQRRFMMVFLLVAALIAVGNLLYYFQVLKPAMEELMFRSHIPVENPADVVFQHVTGFSIAMVVSVFGLVVGLYTVMRIRLQRFMNWLLASIQQVGRKRSPMSSCPGEEFQDLLPVLDRFFEHVSDQQAGRALYVSAFARLLEKDGVSDPDELRCLKRDQMPDSR